MAEKEIQVENSRICPFWRQVAVLRSRRAVTLIALCGRMSALEGELPPLKDFGERMDKCPEGYPPDTAYTNPSIMIYRNGKQTNKVRACVRGAAGIAELQGKWDQVLRKYRGYR